MIWSSLCSVELLSVLSSCAGEDKVAASGVEKEIKPMLTTIRGENFYLTHRIKLYSGCKLCIFREGNEWQAGAASCLLSVTSANLVTELDILAVFVPFGEFFMQISDNLSGMPCSSMYKQTMREVSCFDCWLESRISALSLINRDWWLSSPNLAWCQVFVIHFS